MPSSSRRDPRTFAQKTIAAAIAASALTALHQTAAAQTVSGSGAAVESNAGVSTGTVNRDTTGGLGVGAADPNARVSPVRPGSGPGINNTGSPVLPTPPSLRPPTGANGVAQNQPRIPGNTPPTNTGRNNAERNQQARPAPPGQSPVTPGTTAPGPANPALSRPAPPANGKAAAANRNVAPLPGQTGQILNFIDGRLTYREGMTTSTLSVTPQTVIQLDDRPIAISNIPADAQIRVERSPSNRSIVTRIVATSANNAAGAQAGAASPSASETNAQANQPAGPGGGLSNRPLAPGQNPNDVPLAPFSRGEERRFLPALDEGNTAKSGNQQPQQPARPLTDGSQFLGAGGRGQLPERTDIPDRARPGVDQPTTDNTATLPGTPGNGAARPDSPTDPNTNFRRPDAPLRYPRDARLSAGLGMTMSGTKEGITVGDVSANSIAARSGLLSGDRIQSINGRAVSTPADMGLALQQLRGQQEIRARVIREGLPNDVTLRLPNGFVDSLINEGAAAPTIGASVGLGNGLAVTPDGSVGVGVPVAPGVSAVVGAEGTVSGVPQNSVQSGMATGRAAISGQSAESQGTAGRGGNRNAAAPVGTQRSPATVQTTEALKVPDVNLGWNLRPTPEGVVISELVGGGVASSSKLEAGDVIDSIDGRPVTTPAAVSYELHRHRGGTSVDMTVLREGKRTTQRVRLPEDHQPLLLNTTETFGAANNDAKEQGATPSTPLPVTPTDQSLRVLEQENERLRREIEELRKKQP